MFFEGISKKQFLRRRLTVPSQKTFVNQMTAFRLRRIIALYLLPLSPPGWVNYSKSRLQKRQDITGHLHIWTSNINSTIPLESKIGFTVHLNRMRKLTIHEELEQFVHACQLDVFISLCRVDCIWTDTADTTFYVQEMYNEMFQLCQVWKDGKGRTLAYIH